MDTTEDRRHRPLHVRLVSAAVASSCVMAVVVGAASCTVEKAPFVIAEDRDASGPPVFAGPPHAEGGDAPFVAYCPSNKCPEGHTTCPGSRFACDVDLRTDPNNCGACGSRCPEPNFIETFTCVEGRCELSCDLTRSMNCDGLVDNGCETFPDDPKNCGGCGLACDDPMKPCMNDGHGWKCGCPAGMLTCLTPFNRCVDPDSDDRDCGGCNNFCDPLGEGDAGPPPANTTYGCVGGQCGKLKCNPGYGDCDQDMTNGCETSLTTRENCAACGKTCPADEDCRSRLGVYECLCPAGQTYCSEECVDLATDAKNCGSCGFRCQDDRLTTSIGVCAYGTCRRQCMTGRADCNGNPSDECEVNVDSDPSNCGGCGVVCDAIAGQACVRGRCVVEPCEQGDGGPVAR